MADRPGVDGVNGSRSFAGGSGGGGSDATKVPLYATQSKTTDFTAAAGTIYLIDSTSGTVTVTLPAANSAGQTFGVKWTAGTNAVTLNRAGTDTIGATATTATMALLNEIWEFLSSGTGQWNLIGGNKTLSSLDTRHGAVVAAAGVRATLARGYRSTCIAAIGDSTGDEGLTGTGGEYFWRIGQRLAAAHPEYSLWWLPWEGEGARPGTEEYGPLTVVQTGTRNSGDLRYVEIPSPASMVYTNANTFVGDISYRAWVTPNSGWTPGGAATNRTIVARYSNTGTNRHSWFYLTQDGALNFVWSSNGTADAGTMVSTAAVPFTTGPGWVRVDFDSDNGASGSTGTFYTSTDGTTWTQLGSPVVTVGASSLSTVTRDWTLGSRNATPSDYFNGRFHFVEGRSTLSSTTWTPIFPYLPEQWTQGASSTAIVYGGAPVILMLNGHKGGTAISYYNDSNRRLKLHAQYGQQLMIVTEGHNEAGIVGQAWRVLFDTWINDMQVNRLKYVPIVINAQNPGGSPGDSFTTIANAGRADRQRDQMMYAAAKGGLYPLDAWAIWTDLTSMVPDNLHPGQGAGSGSNIWGDFIYNNLF